MTSNIYHSDDAERWSDARILELLRFETRVIDSTSGKEHHYRGSNAEWKTVPNFLKAESMVELIEVMRKNGWSLKTKTFDFVTKLPYAASFKKKDYESDWGLGLTLQKAVKEAALKALVKEKEYVK